MIKVVEKFTYNGTEIMCIETDLLDDYGHEEHITKCNFCVGNRMHWDACPGRCQSWNREDGRNVMFIRYYPLDKEYIRYLIGKEIDL